MKRLSQRRLSVKKLIISSTMLFTLLLVCIAIIIPMHSMAESGENWWEVTPETEVPSPYYDSILYSEIAPVLHEISQKSDMVDVSVIGKSAGDRDLFLAIVAKGNATQGRFGYYKEIRKLMRTNPSAAQELLETKDIKVPVFINCSIHGDEYPGTDAGIRLIQRFINDDGEETQNILDNIILLFNVIQNPDGRVLGTRRNAAGIDINRDFITMSQPETVATVNIVREWNPMVFLDLHGFVNPMLIEPCTPPHLPNAEYDLFIKWALPQAEAMSAELMAQTGFESIIPFRDWPQNWAWDDWSPSYAGVYSILPGAYGHTLETPYRDIRGVDAHYAAVMGALNYITANKNGMLKDQIEIYRRGFNAEAQQPIPDDILARTEFNQYNELTIGDFPTAYVIPAQTPLQKNPHACAEMINYLITHGVEVEKARKRFTIEGIIYPEHTYVVWMDQPKRSLANTILENGPDLSEVEGGLEFYSPPVSWSVPLLWGVSQTIVRGAFEAETIPAYRARDPFIDIITEENPVAVAWHPSSLNAYKAAGELINTPGISVYRTTSGFTEGDGEISFGTGTFIVSIEDAVTFSEKLITTYNLSLFGLRELPENALLMKKQSIAITDDPALIYTLKQLNIEYTVITDDQGMLLTENTNFDLFINSALYWNVDPEAPGAWHKTGLDENGRTFLTNFFAAEKDYIGFLAPGVSLPIDAAIVDAAWSTDEAGDGIISLDYDPLSPLGAGAGTDTHAYIHDPIWFTVTGENITTVATIAREDFFISGYWPEWQGSGAAGMPVIIHAEKGNQDSILIGIDPVFRCHPKTTFTLIGDAVYSCQE